MRKSKKKSNLLAKASIIVTVIAFCILLIVRLINKINAQDLEKLLETIDRELNSNLNSATKLGEEKHDDVFTRLESMAHEILEEQTRQAKELERQRKLLEKKFSELKQIPESNSVREKLSYVFDYDTSKKFPAYIWQIQTESKNENKKPEETDSDKSESKNLWREKNPGFVYELFDHPDIMNAMIRHHFSSIPEIIEAYNSLPSDILKIDFFKYLMLLARGGVYADLDTNPIVPIPNWIPESVNPRLVGMVIGVGGDPNTKNTDNAQVRKLQFGTWIFQCKPGHPILRELVAKITETTLQRKRNNELNVNVRNDVNVMNWTGAGVWTDSIFSYFNSYLRSGLDKPVSWKAFADLEAPKLLSDVLVFPSFSFSAPREILESDPNKSFYFCTHEKKKSWKNKPRVENEQK